jgi:peptide/nickel transport system substrate-binding protein
MKYSGSNLLTFILIIALSGSLILGGCRGRRGGDGEVVMMIEKKIATFDPLVSSDSAVERMRQLIFNALTRKNEKFEAVGDLAERFEGTPDYKSFTFHLRPGVKFHNGKPLSSLDVKYTFESMIADEASVKRREFIGTLAKIEVKDPLTIVFQFTEPFPGFPNAIVPVGIIPEGTSAQQAEQPVGTGPFKFEDYFDYQEVVLSANPDYFGGPPRIKHLRVKIVPDSSTREEELRKGSVDLAINADLDPVAVEGLQKAEGIKVQVIDGTNITHLGVNLRDPILKDQRVRQALAFATDRQTIIRDLLKGQARVANSVLPVSQWAYEPQVETYPYNPDRARQLLDEAGWKDKAEDPRFNLVLKTSTVSASRKVGEAIQEQWRRIGIALELQPLERGKLTEDMDKGNFQLYLNTSVGGNQSTDIFKFFYASPSVLKNNQNRSRYHNPQIDQLILDAQTASRENQKLIYSQIQKTLANDLPQIYLWYMDTIVIHGERVANLKLEPSGDWQVVRNLELISR